MMPIRPSVPARRSNPGARALALRRWPLFLALGWGLLAAPLDAGLPEPGVTLYGKVFRDGFLAQSGTLVWTYVPSGGGNSIVVTAPLRRIRRSNGDEYSYSVLIPAQRVLSGMPTPAHTLALEPTPRSYTRSASIDGSTVPIVDPAPAVVSIGLVNRGDRERVDLLLSGTVPQLPDMPANPIPNDVQTGVFITSALFWSTSSVPAVYDLFIWKATSGMPSTPIVLDLVSGAFNPPGNFETQTDYLWQVVARNAAGVATGPVWSFRTAVTPPMITRAPSSLTINEGRTAAFTVEALGADLTFRWLKNGSALTSPSAENVLVLPAVTSSDTAEYRAQVTNAGGSRLSPSATLTVIDPAVPNDAIIVDDRTPRRTGRGQNFVAIVGVRNISAVSWTARQGFALGIVRDDGDFFRGATRIEFNNPDEIVSPLGGEIMFYRALNVSKSLPTGSYILQFQMEEQGAGFFGEALSFEIEIFNAVPGWQLYD